MGRFDLIIKKHTQGISVNGIVALVHTLYDLEVRYCSESARKWREMTSKEMAFKLRRIEVSYNSPHTLFKAAIP